MKKIQIAIFMCAVLAVGLAFAKAANKELNVQVPEPADLDTLNAPFKSWDQLSSKEQIRIDSLWNGLNTLISKENTSTSVYIKRFSSADSSLNLLFTDTVRFITGRNWRLQTSRDLEMITTEKFSSVLDKTGKIIEFFPGSPLSNKSLKKTDLVAGILPQDYFVSRQETDTQDRIHLKNEHHLNCTDIIFVVNKSTERLESIEVSEPNYSQIGRDETYSVYTIAHSTLPADYEQTVLAQIWVTNIKGKQPKIKEEYLDYSVSNSLQP